MDKLLTEIKTNQLRKVVFDVLYRNPYYNQGVIATEILKETIPIIKEEVLTKAREAVEGAGLTRKERLQVFADYHSCRAVDITKVELYEYYCQRQTQAILKALGKEEK